MTRPYVVSLRSLALHRHAQSGFDNDSEGSAGLRFVDLLTRRRSCIAPTPPIIAPVTTQAAPSHVSARRDDINADVRGTLEASYYELPIAPLFEMSAPGAASCVDDELPPNDESWSAVMAQTISQFCNEPSVDVSEGWQVRIPLRPQVLPSTTLLLSVSPCWLQLRFETTDSQSRGLLLGHQEALAQLLDGALKRRRDIAISVD